MFCGNKKITKIKYKCQNIFDQSVLLDDVNCTKPVRFFNVRMFIVLYYISMGDSESLR